VYLSALPAPGGIQIAGKTPSDLSYDQHISTMQKRINDTIVMNKEFYNIHPPVRERQTHTHKSVWNIIVNSSRCLSLVIKKLFTLDPEAFTDLNTVLACPIRVMHGTLASLLITALYEYLTL
jgi:hypothetical protein